MPAVWLYPNPSFSTTLTVPFFKKVQPDLGWFYIFFAAFVIVGAANAVNLTDGLDGLAIGPVTIAAGTYMIFSYVAGNVKFAEYLQIIYVPGGGVAVFCGALGAPGWVSSGSTPTRPRSSWGTWGPWPWGGRWAPWP